MLKSGFSLNNPLGKEGRVDAIIDHLENNFSFNTKLQFAGFLAIAKHGDISLCSKFVTINYVKENSVYLSKIILKKG